MTLITIDLPNNINNELRMMKAKENLGNKERAIIKILTDYFEKKSYFN